MRKIVVLTLTLVLTLAMVLGMVPAAFAAQHGGEELPPTEVLMWIDETSYTINDEAAEMDVAPFISDDRTFAPVGFVAEAFGLQADWGPREALTEWVTFENGELFIEIEIGSPYITVTEEGEERTVTADVAAQIVEDRTYLPLRAVGEIFGAEFDWGPREAMTEWVSFSYGIAEPVVPEEPPEEPAEPENDEIDVDEPENDEPAVDEVNISIEDFSFDPQTVTVSQGATVVWTNEGAETHTVTSAGNFDSGDISPGETFSFVFDEDGTFDYFCQPHPFMEGTIIVE